MTLRQIPNCQAPDLALKCLSEIFVALASRLLEQTATFP